ncbi:hypothetical protein Golomagni_07135 [Golovinomyces magnicellulatus]|nr:hypothetical protein Golomagni_07135 [Golovinomyces magnicellulatus]
MRTYSSPSECNDSNIDAEEAQSPFAPSNYNQPKDIKKTKSKDKPTNTPSPSRRKKVDKLHLKDKEDHYFSCPIDDCRKKFARKTDLERHNKSVHIKERNHECTYCGRLFARKDTLRRHMDDGCPKRFDIETVTFGHANVGEATRWTNTDIQGARQPAGLHAENSPSF